MEEFFGIISMDDLAKLLLAIVGLILLVLFVIGWRNRVMMRLGLRNIPRRRAQTVLIVFGLMLSTLIVAAAFGTGDTMTHSFRSLALDDLGEVDEVINRGGVASFTSFEMEFDEEGGGAGGGRSQSYFGMATFDSLASEVAELKAQDSKRAEIIEALAPVIDQRVGPIINLTARQSEPSAGMVGYEPESADDFDEMHRLDGKQVTIAELEPDAERRHLPARVLLIRCLACKATFTSLDEFRQSLYQHQEDECWTECDACGHIAKAADLKPYWHIHHLYERLTVGCEVPVGECEECGALAYIWPLQVGGCFK